MQRLILIPALLLLLGVPFTSFASFDAHTDAAEAREEQGIEPSDAPAASPARTGRPIVEVLLIPDSNADVIGMYDPNDGTYLGDFNQVNPGFGTPLNAVQGPDQRIYVSDQIADAVFVFDFEGNYEGIYADASDGLNNIRGIAFRDGELFVTSGDDYIARFDGPHSRLPDWIHDGSDPFDLYFLADGSALVADIQGTADNIRYYDAQGTLQYELFPVNFPEQIQFDPVAPGEFLNAAYSGDVVTDFELDGTIQGSWAFNGGRGVYRLYDGRLLLTAGDGVWAFDPATGGLEQKNTGSGRYIELMQGTSGIAPREPEGRLQLRSAPLLGAAGVQFMFALPENTPVELGIYDVRGARIATLLTGTLPEGAHTLVWDGRTTTGGTAASGLYFAALRTSRSAATRQIMLLR